jgi:hypothetical protein
MLIENEPRSVKYEYRSGLILSLLFIAVLLVSICALSILVLEQLKALPSTPHQGLPDILIPATSLPAAIPDNRNMISLPMILSESVSVSEQIWKVTKIKTQGYELDGQHFDVATFTHVDGQDTAQGYCINRGWDIPDIGTEYLFNAEGIFVPLYQSDAHPIQRFLRIQQ